MTKTRDLANLGGGFIQEGTGAVQRTVESRLKDVVSVKDFGAVGNGTTDDSAAIQAAIDSIEPGSSTPSNGRVYFPAGTYYVASTIRVNGDGVHLIGAGAEATTLKRSDTGTYGPMISLTGTERRYDNSIQGMTLLSTAACTSSSHIQVYSQVNINLKDLVLWNPYIGVDTRSSQFVYNNVKVEYDNTIYTSTIGSAAFSWKVDGITGRENSGFVQHCEALIRQSPHDAYPAEYGFLIESMDGIWISDCYSRAASKSAYLLNPASSARRVTGMLMTNCWADWPGEVGLLMQNVENGNSGNHIITNFRVYGGASSTEATIYGIVVGNPDANTTGGNVKNVLINQAFPSDTKKSGIELRKQCEDVSIVNPRVLNASIGTPGLDPSVNVKAGVSNWSIIGGTLDGNGNGGNSSASVGVEIAAGSSDNYRIIGSSVQRCQTTEGIIDGGTGVNKQIVGCTDAEGVVTATLTPNSGSITLDSSLNQLKYSKVGSTVTVTGSIDVASVSSPSGTLRIDGLPFPTVDGPQSSGVAVAAVRITGTSGVPNGAYWTGRIVEGSANMSLELFNGDTGINTAVVITASTRIQLSVTYITG